jgi:hypothetical protein
MSDLPAPIFAADDEELPELPERHRLTVWRFLGALLLASFLYFLLVVALVTVGFGLLALFVAIVPAVWASGRVMGITGFPARIVLGILAFLVVNVVAYVIISVSLYSNGTIPAGG